MKSLLLLSVLACSTVFLCRANEPASAAKHTFVIGTNNFLLDGKPFEIRCGEIHAARVPKAYWRNRLAMAKAMGLNTVCAYLFWNQIEPEPGKFNWSGRADIADFCRIAQQEGLWVILRPGPYACAEWEMGGLPWWLLKDKNIHVRSRDPHFLNPACEYLKAVGRELGPLQITRGGPIIMVQVENEYGFFGKDKKYMEAIRQAVLDAGFDVPLFCCDPPSHLEDGYITNLFPVVNFGADPEGAFKALRKILPQGPLMCGEFYPGWFDTWGSPHHLGNTPRYLADLKYMLQHHESFSIYMAHGGTTFGLWAGCNRPFKPDTSSYDYDAPISEAGWPTKKFYDTRALFAKYLQPGETLPPVPATNPVITIAPVQATECAPVFDNLPPALNVRQPRNMEAYNQGYGCILYRTTIPAGPSAMLKAAAVHDFGYVYLGGKRVGIFDRRTQDFKMRLPARKTAARLDVLVEPMGRVNFGPEMADRKGLFAPVQLGGKTLTGWKVFRLPLNEKMIAGLKFTDQLPGKNTPAFWRVMVNIKKPGDTFLDLRGWSKGDIWVNGHCLARYWDIGPTQTAYTPGCWLHPGTNEIIILDLLGPRKPVIEGLAKPILNELRPRLDFDRSLHPKVKLNIVSAEPVMVSQFKLGPQMQTIKFPKPAKGRYFCLEAMSSFDGKPFAAVGELNLLDRNGNPISHNDWTIAYVDSEERVKEDGSADNAINGQTADYWITEWGAAQPEYPHQLVIDMGKEETVSGFRYVPRQSAGPGRIQDYRIYVGDHLIEK